MNSGTTLQDAVQRYLRERRQLGFALTAPATELMRFARYADARGHEGPLTRELQLTWAREHVRRTSEVTAARRVEILRPFAAYYRQFEVKTEVLPPWVAGRGHRRLSPHIYTDEEIAALLLRAQDLSPHGGLRPTMYKTLFGLVAAAGLRLSEALRLRICDADLHSGAVAILQTKFHKSRRLPVHVSVVEALTQYRRVRDLHACAKPEAPFFVSRSGGPLSKSIVQNVFESLRSGLRWRARGDYASPRIHDLRHTFAVRRLQRWHETGVPIDHGMFWLCTYLGHAKISDTYWYLSGVPELMDLVGSKFERFALAGAPR